MTSFRRLALFGLTMATGDIAAAAAAASGQPIPIYGRPAASIAQTEISADSSFAAHIMKHARRLDDGGQNNYNNNFDYIADYSLKFQGCHHISQWNEDADEEDEVRIQTKRLARFRLCPSGSCSDSKTAGCNSKYGDYIVDMETFVYSFLQARQDDMQNECAEKKEVCYDMCGNADDDCMYGCYANYGLSYCVQGDDSFDPSTYAQCAQFEFGNYRRDRRLDEYDYGNYDYDYYVGPYCADQGGSIHLGLFTDNTCTTFASGGTDTFFEKTGFELPYSKDSLISYDCLSCADESNNYNNAGDGITVKEFCQGMYATAGKCENKMQIDNPNDAACTYIEGVKIIRNDGVIRTHSVRKSKAAAITIGLFTTLAVLLGAYVFYLRNKLGRAKINLAAQG